MTQVKRKAYLDIVTSALVKYCKACDTVKPVGDFPVKQILPNGKPHYSTHCRPCKNIAQNRKYHGDIERRREQARGYYQKDTEFHAERQRIARQQWSQETKTRKNKEQKIYHAKNKDRLRESNQKWLARHPDYRKQHNEQYREQNRERLNAYDRERHKTPQRQEQVKDAQARRRARILGSKQIEKIRWTVIIKRDNSTCYICKRTLTRKEITFDHVIPLSRQGAHTEGNLKVACRVCNGRKGAKLPEEIGIKLEAAGL